MNRSFIILICFLFTGWNVFGQAQQVSIWKFNIEDGLVNNDVLNIYQDSRGFIWLCTRGGLSRYDGSRFTNFTPDNGLATDMINDIYEVAPQKFIIAQNSGGPVWLINERIRPIPENNTITINQFYSIQNRLVGTTDFHGIVEWNGSTFRPVNTSYKESISSMTAINDSAWVLINLPYSLTFSFSFLKSWLPPVTTDVTSVFTDSKHRTWVGTVHGLKLLDNEHISEKKIAFRSLPPSFNVPLLREAYIDAMMEDSQGNMWIGTVNGLVRVDSNENTIIYTQESGLPASQVNCLREDREKNIWIGTPLGLARISLTNVITTLKLAFGPSHDGTLGVLPVSEKSWRIFDGKNISQLDAVNGKLMSSVPINAAGYQGFQLNDKEILIANNGKAKIYHDGGERIEVVEWPSGSLGNVIRKDSLSFLGTRGDTILRIKNGIPIEKFKASIIMMNHLLIDRNNYLWAASHSNGVYKIKMNENAGATRFQIIDTIASQLPDQNIRAIFTYRKNELWIGTRYKGLVRLLELSNGKYKIQAYGKAQGLSSDFVLSINCDPYGNIWVGTLQGLDKLIPSGNEYRVFNFGIANKYFSKVYDIKFASNNYMIVTGYPYLLYTRDLQQDTLSPPNVFITKVSPGPSDTSFISNSILHLPTNRAQIYFEFSAAQFINEDFTKYSYRLLGYGDTSWKLSGKSRNVYFASLRPGNYTFEIRALGFNDQWGTPATYAFIVNTPYWQKGGFILMMSVLLGLIVYGLYRYRVRQLLHVQNVRNRIATDLHDEIGSTLTNINILSTLGKRNLAQPQKAGDFLNRISDEVSSSSQALDDIIWSVNTSHDTLEETVARMRRYAAELFDAANISYELYLDPAFEARKIGMEQRRDLYLLYKEAVNNISKHASAKQVAIQLAIEGNQLMLIVKDDGTGFDTQKRTERHGLEGMKDRIKKWRGKINLESRPGKGTMVQVWMPLTK